MNRFPTALNMDTKNEPTSASRKPSTRNPSMKDAAKRNSNAFIIKMNNPRVTIVIGNVSMTRIGFMITFKTPKISAVTIAMYKLSTVIPGTK